MQKRTVLITPGPGAETIAAAVIAIASAGGEVLHDTRPQPPALNITRSLGAEKETGRTRASTKYVRRRLGSIKRRRRRQARIDRRRNR